MSQREIIDRKFFIEEELNLAIVKITDDFDMKRIAESGQCFRAAEVRPNIFRFITREKIVYMKKAGEGKYDVSCSNVEWEKTWVDYFDLTRDYAKIRENILNYSSQRPYGDYMKAAIEFGQGIRILKQEPFETLISFIISQRKNIPAIKNSIEMICGTYGKRMRTEYEAISTFPGIDILVNASVFDLSNFALGYRGPYVRDAIEKVSSRAVDLEVLHDRRDTDMLDTLQKIRGVGKKIAACVALYAYHRLNIMPVDTWIQKAIDEDFSGQNVFYEMSAFAGIVQQYVFYYKRLAEKGYWLVG